jgi:predicted TIM-barrel fold metal-dependent hydrolase
MDAMGLDYQVVFPTPMLVLGMHPQEDIEAAVGRAYNRWLIERILPDDERIKGLLYLPFNSPKACEDIVRDFGDAKGVIGFTVTCTRNRPVHHDQYMKLYAMIEETGQAAGLPLRLPLGRPVVPAAQPLSSRCTPFRSCTTRSFT